MALNIGRGQLSAIQAAITSGTLKAGDIVVTRDMGNELILIERDNTQVVVGVGAVKNPTYDAETRTITLPVKQADGTTQDLVINLGKDNFVESGVYNAETKEIELTLVSGDVVKIPAATLVDVYTGGETATATVSVSDDNVITSVTKISTVASNLLKSDENGLYVLETDFVATKQLIVDAQAAAETHADEAVAAEATARDEAIATAKTGAETTAKNYTDEQIAAEVTARNEAIATAKSGAEATAKGYTDEKVAAEVTARDEAIATAKGEANSYTDGKISDEVTARNEAIATAKSEAITDANKHSDDNDAVTLAAAKEYADGIAANLGVKWIDFGA